VARKWKPLSIGREYDIRAALTARQRRGEVRPGDPLARQLFATLDAARASRPEPKEPSGDNGRITPDGDTLAWLVERGQSMRQAPTVWWTGTDWTTDAYRALRFLDREQAEAYIDAHSGFGIPSHGDRFGVAVEHLFIASRPEPGADLAGLRAVAEDAVRQAHAFMHYGSLEACEAGICVKRRATVTPEPIGQVCADCGHTHYLPPIEADELCGCRAGHARGVTVSPDLVTAAQAVVDDVWPWESDQSYGVSKAALLNLRRILAALPASPAPKEPTE
jgi:hypothetical protein